MSFKFIEELDIALSAGDATEEDELDMGGIFIGQTKQVAFKLGNTGASETIFTITASGQNPTIVDDVEFSSDQGGTWETSATVSGIAPNAVTERILCRYTPGEEEITASGTFLIRVDEI